MYTARNLGPGSNWRVMDAQGESSCLCDCEADASKIADALNALAGIANPAAVRDVIEAAQDTVRVLKIEGCHQSAARLQSALAALEAGK